MQPPSVAEPSSPGPVYTEAAECDGCPGIVKFCVYQPKPNTKTVYACRTEEYCLPRCSLLALLRGNYEREQAS